VLAALRFYVSDWKGLRFYVSPKYQFGRTTSERIAGAPVYGTDSTSTSRTHGVYGAWGVQYAISDRVSIFGDMGGYYSRATGTTTNLATLGGDSHGSAIGTSGSWGLILYLK
jgi:hypothetical protein